MRDGVKACTMGQRWQEKLQDPFPGAPCRRAAPTSHRPHSPCMHTCLLECPLDQSSQMLVRQTVFADGLKIEVARITFYAIA